ncbi:MAG: hypothetical protein QXU97_01535 [Fervidicoccaceae archaeon]
MGEEVKEAGQEEGEKREFDEEKTSSDVIELKKHDLKTLLSVIPPAVQLRAEKKARSLEKRIRVKYGDVGRDQIAVGKELSKELELGEEAYLTVAGRKRFLLKVIVREDLPAGLVLVNGDLMRENGVADNSIATLRRA